jgi:hypothetical protein
MAASSVVSLTAAKFKPLIFSMSGYALSCAAKLTSPAYNISAQNTQKTPFHCCSVLVSMETWLFAEPLLSNSCCIAAYFAVIA